MTRELPPGADAIGRIMGTTADQAFATLSGMYGSDIAMEVLHIGRIWDRSGLTRRERSFVAIAALVAMGTKDRLRIHVQGALNHGATREEIEEVILTTMIYAGHGRATEAIEVARQVLADWSPS
ncbi:MAG: carboxymuconolactone decarboxylase family protein [Candidatus Rokubacteria bacterium]|nr:carboxymuconolactone decarboxylase family protein [Candidatus Rokubacteria bacterium]